MMKMRLMLFTGILLAVAAQVFAFPSNSLCIDTRTSFGGLIATGVEQVGEPEGAQVSNWDTTTLEDGWTSLDAGSISKSVCVLNETALVHGGRLTEDETWAADVIHVIRGNVVVPSGKTLTLASGAVVKFTEGAQIAAEGSGEVFLLGAQCADIADDTVGGDTNFDAEGSSPTTDFANWFGDGVSPLSVSFISQDNDQFPTCYYSSGITIGALPTPTRDGYTFLGWFTAAEGGEQVTADTVVTGDMTLYAQWEKEGSDGGGEEYTPASLFEYGILDGGIIIIKYIGDDEVVKIPPFINGFPVVSIRYSAFNNCDGLTSITIPDSVTSIDASAFAGCSSLTRFIVDLNNPQYKSVNGLLLTIDGKTLIAGIIGDVVIPQGVMSIGDFAFSERDGLTSVTIPDSVTSIGRYAFSRCGGFNGVMIPDSVTSIGDYAFEHCDGLMSVTIPDSVMSIGDNVFYSCDGLTSVTIPDSVTSIGRYAFFGCDGLTSVTIPDSVTSIGYCAFADCNGLTSVTIPNSVTSIGNNVFYSCESLTYAKVPFALKEQVEVGKVFSNCSSDLQIDYYCIVTFNANGGALSEGGAIEAIVDETIGTLPIPTRDGYTFLGWFTAAEGGTKISASTKVTDDVTYYAHWIRNSSVPNPTPTPTPEPVPELGEGDYEVGGEMSDTSIPENAASVYDGYLYGGNEVAGTIQAKVARPKNGIAKVTTTIQITGEKKVSVKGELDVESGRLEAVAKNGRELYLEFGVDGMSGSFGVYEIDGTRNFFSSKDKDEKSAAEEILEPYLGGYSMICDGGILSVNIAKKGKVTVKGTYNGEKVSAKAQALIGEEMICIPVIYSKKSVNVAFTIWLPIDGGNAEIIGLDDAVIGKAGTLKNGARFIVEGDIGDFIETEDPRTLELLPDNETITVSKSKWLVADGSKPAKVAYKKGEFTITEGKKGAGIVNPSGLKLSFKSKDGSFTGSFTAYAIVKGKLKKHKATVEGVLVNGIGYGSITIKKIGTWAVTIE